MYLYLILYEVEQQTTFENWHTTFETYIADQEVLLRSMVTLDKTLELSELRGLPLFLLKLVNLH